MIKFLPALPHAATIPLAILLLAACGHKNGNQAIGSADGPTEIFATDGGAVSEGIIGGADGPTAIYVSDGAIAPDKDSANTEGKLAAKGLELISRMSRLASSRQYLSLATSSQPILDEAAVIAAADYTSPKEIFVIDGACFKPDTTDFIASHIKDKAIRSTAAMINGLNGPQTLSAAAMLQADDAFVCRGLDHTVIYLYAYDAVYSAVVSYKPCADGTVLAAASFVRFPSSGSAAVSRYVAETIASALGSTDITVRSIGIK